MELGLGQQGQHVCLSVIDICEQEGKVVCTWTEGVVRLLLASDGIYSGKMNVLIDRR